jgi:hypothetical protein
MMEMHSVRGAVHRAYGRDWRIALFGKDCTIVPTSDAQQDGVAGCRPMDMQIDAERRDTSISRRHEFEGEGLQSNAGGSSTTPRRQMAFHFQGILHQGTRTFPILQRD